MCLWSSLALVYLVGCSTTRPGDSTAIDASKAARYGTADEIEYQLRRQEAQWRGTPYRWGGTSRSGMDCSGFVLTVYRDAFGVTLPRSTEAQAAVGYEISAASLQAGDLVFFKPSRKTRHVGIYLGNGEFAHASTSQGVTISHLYDPYWEKAFWTTRRLLPAAAASRASPANQTTDRPLSRRSGW